MGERAGDGDNATRTERQQRPSSDALRQRLVDAATVEFAEFGFEGASTRRIAAAAKAHQPQINYHFDSKEALWRAVVDLLMAELAVELATGLGPDSDEVTTLERGIRNMVSFVAVRPELQRIVVHEGSMHSGRLEWLVDRYLRANTTRLADIWNVARERGVAADISPVMFNYMFLGICTRVYISAPEARLLWNIEPTDSDFVAEHADAAVALLLPGLADDG